MLHENVLVIGHDFIGTMGASLGVVVNNYLSCPCHDTNSMRIL